MEFGSSQPLQFKSIYLVCYPYPLFFLNLIAKIKESRLYFIITVPDSSYLYYNAFLLLANTDSLSGIVVYSEKYVI